MQPPSGGCVLKPGHPNLSASRSMQPPSGGCVLKLFVVEMTAGLIAAAAFGRLCVETQVFR